MVHQHFMLVENFTVLENVMLGAEGGALLKSSHRQGARASSKRLEREYGLEVDPDAIIDELPVGLQQRVEILKALYRGAEILILDEPTGVLTPAEADHLFRILEQLKEQGKTIILITHKLREIMAITDNVSVMRRGEMVATRGHSETTVERTGRADGRPPRAAAGREGPGEARRPSARRSSNLTVKDGRGVTMVDDVSFDVRAGEIVGIAGVAGNGQSELLEAIAGIRRAVSGAVDARRQADRRDRPMPTPASCATAGLAHVPEDRHHVGPGPGLRGERELDPRLSRRGAYLQRPVPRHRRDPQRCQDKIEKYDIRPADSRLKTANFSGGNQQKIVLAREIEQDPGVLIVGQPTRGVDIGAIEFIHKRLIAHARPRQGDPAGLGRARRDPLAVRPHPGDVCRPHRRRARPGRRARASSAC